MSAIPLVLVLLALLGGAVALRRASERGAVAAIAPVLSGAALLGAALHLAQDAVAARSGAGAPPDLLASVLLGGVTLSLFVMCLGAPRAEAFGERLSSAFALAAAFAAACFTHGTRPLAVVVALSAVPLARPGRAAILPVLGSMSMSAGLFWLAQVGHAVLPVTGDAPSGALALVWIGAWMRIGLLPFHGWLPVLFERGYPVKAILSFVANPGTLVLVRVCLGTRWMSGQAGHLFTALAALSALYGAFLCLGQRDLLRAVGWQALASSGLVVTGLCSREAEGITGAIVHIAASGLFLSGLTLVAWGVRARFGGAPISGIGQRARHASAAFLLFGLAAAGFPGTLCFVSEDLLLHGVIEHRPIVGTLLVLTTALSAIAMIRLFFLVFFGPGRTGSARPGLARELVPDLFRREKAALGLLLAVILGLGLSPWPAVRAAELSASIVGSGPH